MSVDQYGIHLGFLYIRYYGLIIMFGVIMATLLTRWMLRQMGKDPEIVWDALTWVLIFGVIGARLYHVFTPSRYSGITTADYFRNPIMILTTWEGGLAIPGAIIGGVLGIYIFARRNKLDMGILVDAAAPGLALAQAIGRWGNYVNQELYGPPTDLPWGIFIDTQHRLREYLAFEYFHPLFLYESIWNLLNVFLLIWIFRRFKDWLIPGDLFLVYLITYPIGRFLLEFIRLDYVPLLGINFNQGFMLLVAIGSGLAIYLRHRKKNTAEA
jgi:phosphatidylglycerol:prolipoprotein diacylglycerol transferase